MKRFVLALTCAAFAAISFGVVRADEEKKEALPTEIACTVSGAKVDVAKATSETRYIDYEYNRYYFCCNNCPKAFEKDPEKYASKPSIALSKIEMPKELACAVMTDHKLDVKKATEEKMFADYNGSRYYFCCAGCVPAFKKEPEKFAKNARVSLGQLPLPKTLKCAVEGKEINVKDALSNKMFADYKGRRYLFCCPGCPAAFKEDPAKFASAPSLPSPKRETKKSE
jgi:YHS domain-containing protein